MGKTDNGKSAVAAAHTKHAAATTIPSYHDKDGNIHYPALKSTHKHFVEQGVLHLWRCGRCTSRNAAESTECGGCGCGHRRCGKDCEWLVRKGPKVKKPAAAAAATQGQGSCLQQQQQGQKAGSDEEASGASGEGQLRGAAVAAADDDGVHLPSPPDEIEGQGDVNGIATVPFVEQTQYWICCSCGKDDNPAAAASCQKALCGHIRGSHCAERWVDG